MKILLELGLVVFIVAIILCVWKFVDEKVCTHVCPKRKECTRKNKMGELPPCVTCHPKNNSCKS